MLEKRVRTRAPNRAAPWIFAVAAAVMPFTVSAQSPLPAPGQALVISSEARPAKRATAPAPKQVDLSAVPQITAKELAALAVRPRPPRPRAGGTEQQYAALKAQAAQLRFEIPNLKPMSGPPASAQAGSIPASAGTEGVLTPVASVAFYGNAQGSYKTACGGWFPADMGLAVGDTDVGVVQVNNACISVFSKSGVLQAGYPKSLYSFFGQPSTAFIGEPRALYDWANHRYIILSDEYNCTSGCWFYLVAVSAGDDPTGTYYIYNLPVSFPPDNLGGGVSRVLSLPRLGQDRQAIYVASNVWTECCSGNAEIYSGEEWLLLPKSAMYAGTGFTYNVIDKPGGLGLDSSQPANVFSYLDNPRAEFFVTSFNGLGAAGGTDYQACQFTSPYCNGLVVWAVSNPLDTTGPGPELSYFIVPTTYNYSFPPNADQPGNYPIDSGDASISGEVTYVAGALYAALTTNNGAGGPGVILYKIQPVLNRNDDARCTGAFLNLCPQITGAAIISENFLNYGGQNSAFFPTQQPDPEGNVTTVFNYSSPNDYVSTAYISSRVTQGVGPAANNFEDSGHILAAGRDIAYEGCAPDGPVCIWGYYTGVAPAGIGGSTPTPTMWFAGAFVASRNLWATAIGKTGFTRPDQP